MKKNNNFFTIFINNFYNYIFKKKNNIFLDIPKSKNSKNIEIKSIKHSTALYTVWLLNLKRLHKIIKKKISLENYHFIDVGCGIGIPLIYAYKKLKFKSYSGFDLVPDYISITKKNINHSVGSNSINVFEADAADIVLEDKSYFIFMYNPFDEIIMEKFLKNNYENFIKNNSVIAYSNCNQLNSIKKFTKNIQEIKKYKLASCYF
jgi:SAM-dependent methyltransferase